MTEDDRPIVEQFFEAVKNAPLSSVTIAEAAGCARQQVDFVRARARISRLDLAERIAKAIGFRLALVLIEPSNRSEN